MFAPHHFGNISNSRPKNVKGSLRLSNLISSERSRHPISGPRTNASFHFSTFDAVLGTAAREFREERKVMLVLVDAGKVFGRKDVTVKGAEKGHHIAMPVTREDERDLVKGLIPVRRANGQHWKDVEVTDPANFTNGVWEWRLNGWVKFGESEEAWAKSGGGMNGTVWLAFRMIRFLERFLFR